MGIFCKKNKVETFTISAATDKGIRKMNQDNLYLMEQTLDHTQLGVYERTKKVSRFPIILGVFDGMGGERSGEEASELAADLMCEIETDRLLDMEDEDLEMELCGFLRSISNEIHHEYGLKGIRAGCTGTLCYIDRGRILFINAGDSPAFLYMNGECHVMSVADNQAGQLYRLGRISEEESWTHPMKSRLTQFLGMNPEEVILSPHTKLVHYQPGQKFVALIGSDGLTDGMPMNKLRYLAFSLKEPEDDATVEIGRDLDLLISGAKDLVKKSIRGGSRDNVTAILVTNME
ncbi:Serine/threonine protein phosphatase PrpC [Lachnospiraceae bacterium C10]|jgi:serine/threonine protein phosphatase PrpC|nr:Serine/threonine protein phosphatase PrpC [Lachnospiraceae bacterium C10]